MPKPDAIPAGAAPTPADALRDSRPGTAQLSRRVDPLARGGVRGPDRGGAALDAVRIHGGYGYSTEYDVERYFRDAPLMIVGEGTNEIQKNVIAKQLVDRGGLPY